MQYNLLNYGASGNLAARKDTLLRPIIQYVQPDIFGANEINNSTAMHQRLVDSVLGSGWERGGLVNSNGEFQTNNLFWKSDKFGLKQQQSICQELRDIIVYTLYYKANLTTSQDTIFLKVIVAHLKASQGYEYERSVETQHVADYLNSLSEVGNCIFMGDFNVYTSEEPAYQNVVAIQDENRRLYDPISMPGDWNGNSSFAAIHTQSTRTSSLNDGGSNGGLDDRFDIQLISRKLLHAGAGMKYQEGSYTAVGQDGQHFNSALTSWPTNTSAPADIIQKLYRMSDHLPVYSDYKIGEPYFTGVNAGVAANYNIQVVNPLGNKLSIYFDTRLSGKKISLRLHSIDGQIVYRSETLVNSTGQKAEFDLNRSLNPGIYFLNMQAENGFSYSSKLVKY
jgi:hypothetical protein